MASTPAEVFAQCVRGLPASDAQVDRMVDEAESEAGTRALFTELIEPLSDSFEPRLAAAYVDVFARILERMQPSLKAASLVNRFESFQIPTGRYAKVVVLSRVTLGADVAVTSPFLAGASAAYPDAEIVFAGNTKNHELFSERVEGLGLLYGRTSLLRDRVRVSMELAELLDKPGTLVIDPDSRLSQLGLLPLAPPERYLYFPSRTYRADSDWPMARLASTFVEETLGLPVRPFIAPPETGWVPRTDVTISLGVGENAAKRVDGEFEYKVIQGLLDQGHTVMLDKGAGGEETARVEALEFRCQGPLYTWQGAFAPFAEAIRNSRLYIGYDSAGQHVAAACGTPQVTVFAGAPNAKFSQRWRPWADEAKSAICTPKSARS